MNLSRSWWVALVAVALSAASVGAGARETLRERWEARREAARQEASAESPAGRIAAPGDYRFTVRHDGRERAYRLHVPAGYRPGHPIALLLALHGGGGNMDIQADDRFYGQITSADQHGYAVAFPNGSSRLPGNKLATWNAGLCCGYARDQNIDDVGFLKAVVRDVQSRVDIQSDRIFADGMSNGGMMSHRLACEAADVFRAVAAVAGTDGNDHCVPARPVSVLHIHAKDDPRVLFTGGSGSESATHADFVSVADTLERWLQRDSCAPRAERVLEVKGAYCDLYRSCKGAAQVQLCVADEGGHSWPGGTKPRGGGEGSKAISANDVIWQFFSQQR